MMGAVITVFVVENYCHWKDNGNIHLVSLLAPVLVLKPPPTKQKLGNKMANKDN